MIEDEKDLQDAIIKLGLEAMKSGARVDTLILDKVGYDLLWWVRTKRMRAMGDAFPYPTQMTVMTPAGEIKIRRKE